MSDLTFRDRLWQATQDSLVLGVRVLVFLAVILLGAGWIVGDYTTTRQKADYAFTRIVAAENAQRAQQQRQQRAPE